MKINKFPKFQPLGPGQAGWRHQLGVYATKTYPCLTRAWQDYEIMYHSFLSDFSIKATEGVLKKKSPKPMQHSSYSYFSYFSGYSYFSYFSGWPCEKQPTPTSLKPLWGARADVRSHLCWSKGGSQQMPQIQTLAQLRWVRVCPRTGLKV